MLSQIIAADLTIPAGTTQAAPATLVVPIQSGWIPDMTLTIPPGPNGLVGWALVLGGTILIPYAGAGWVVASDYTFRWRIDRWINQGNLVAQGYNSGQFPHTLRAKFTWQPNEPGLTVTASIAANSPAADATAAAVTGLTGFGPDDQAAAELAQTGS